MSRNIHDVIQRTFHVSDHVIKKLRIIKIEMMKNRMIQWLVSDFILEKSEIRNLEKLNIDRKFMLTHTAPTCGKSFLGKTILHAERGRRVSQCKGLINITFSSLARIKTRP